MFGRIVGTAHTENVTIFFSYYRWREILQFQSNLLYFDILDGLHWLSTYSDIEIRHEMMLYIILYPT